jgi:hypothetical protein
LNPLEAMLCYKQPASPRWAVPGSWLEIVAETEQDGKRLRSAPRQLHASPPDSRRPCAKPPTPEPTHRPRRQLLLSINQLTNRTVEDVLKWAFVGPWRDQITDL